MSKIENLLSFLKITHKLQQIQRATFATGEDRFENDSEHSFQLAIICWYMITVEKLDFDTELVLKYALIHDLVEIYAGDTPLFTSTKEYIESQNTREKEATKKLKKDLPKKMHRLIENYLSQTDKESIFVNAIDKFLSSLNAFSDGGKTWKHYKLSSKQIIQAKKEKMKKSKEGMEYLEEFIVLLRKNPQLFN